MLYQKWCDLSIDIGICRNQSPYSQLWIASVFPWISLDNLFCLICNQAQVLSQHTGPKLCPAAAPRLSPHLGSTNCPGTDPVPPAGKSPFWFGNSAACEVRTISDNPAHLFMWWSSRFVPPQSRRKAPGRSTEGEFLHCCAMTMFEGGHLLLTKTF